MQKMNVLSVAYGPMPDGNGTYAKIWVSPIEWEDRSAPHTRKGPAPFEIKCDYDLAQDMVSHPIPGVYELDLQTSIASGAKATAKCVGWVAPKAAPVVTPTKI